MQYFPLFMDLNNQPVLVVGGGEVASRKVETLIRAGANVTIVSPTINAELNQRVTLGECHWYQGFYSLEVMDTKYVQVWATTDNSELNHRVHKDAKAKRIAVNVVDDVKYCDFITPSIVNRGRIQIAISSGGGAPVLIRNIRERLESVLPTNLSLLADFCTSKRNSIKEHFDSVDERRKFWEFYLALPEVVVADSRPKLEQAYQSALLSNIDMSGSITWIHYGNDVELLTLKALKALQQTEWVVSDVQCPFDFIDLSRRDAERFTYENSVELSKLLQSDEIIGRKLCIFIPEKDQDFKMLMHTQTLLKLGK